MTPGPKTTGRPLPARARSSDRIPPTPASARASSGLHQHHLGQLALTDTRRGHEWKAVAAWTVDEVVRSVARERIEQWSAVLAQRAGLEHLLHDRLAVLQHAQVKRDRSRVDAGYTGHIIRCMSSTKDKPRTYSEDEIPAKFSEYGLDEWYYEDKWIRRKYNTDGWPTTLMAVNAVGYLCEAAGHHADLNVTWGKLWVKLATHSAGGITDKDFTLARKIEDTILWRPDADGPLDGPMGKFVFSKSRLNRLEPTERGLAHSASRATS